MRESNKVTVIEGPTKIEDFFDFSIYCFKFVGFELTPSEDSSLRAQLKKYLLLVYYFLCNIGIWMFFVVVTARFLIDITDVTVIIRTLPNVTNVPYNSSKSILFYVKRQVMLDMLESLRKYFPKSLDVQQRFNFNEKVKNFIKTNKVYAVFYLLLMSSISLGSGYHFIFNHFRKPLIDYWVPFDDLKNDFNFLTASFFIIWGGTNICIILIGADFFIFGIVYILSLEFKVLSDEIKNAVANQDAEKIRKLFIDHQMLMEVSDKFQVLFRYLFFWTFLQGGIAVSTSGFQLVTANDIIELFYCMSYSAGSITQIFLFCYYGEKLINSSYGICESIADSDWYALKDEKLKKQLMFMMLRSQKPCTLSAYGLVTLSMETFSSVLKTSYSYFTLLKKMYFD